MPSARGTRCLLMAGALLFALPALACSSTDSPTLQVLGLTPPRDWAKEDCVSSATSTLEILRSPNWLCQAPGADATLNVNWWIGRPVSGYRKWQVEDSVAWARLRDSIVKAMDARSRRERCPSPRVDEHGVVHELFWRGPGDAPHYLHAEWTSGTEGTRVGSIMLDTGDEPPAPCTSRFVVLR